MNPKDVKPFQTGPGGPFELATDEDGRLFSPHMREIISSHAPAEAVPAVEAFAAVGQAARLMRLNMERWAEKEGLSEMRVAILFMLRYAGGALPLGTLAGKLQVSPRNVTGLVDNLERDGLVARVHDPGDRRSVLAQLTDHGRERLAALSEIWTQRQRALMVDFTEDELAQLRHLSLRLVCTMGRPKQTGRE